MSLLRHIMDAQSAMFEEYAERTTQFYERAAGIMLGRKPWSWTSFPGLGTAPGCMWQRQALPKSATWRAAITSIRIDGGEYGLQCYVAARFRRRVDETALERKP